MATKLEEKKASIGYIKGDPPSCANCEHFSSWVEKVQTQWTSQPYWKERDMKCTLHGFATKKKGFCNNHHRKEKS